MFRALISAPVPDPHDDRLRSAVGVYGAQFTAGVLILVVGVALVPDEILAIVLGLALVGPYLFVLSHRRWKRALASTSLRVTAKDSRRERTRAQLAAGALPIVAMGVGAFVLAHFATDGARFTLAGAGAAMAGLGLGVALGRFGEFSRGEVVREAARFWFARDSQGS
jgi:hypothetical protein